MGALPDDVSTSFSLVGFVDLFVLGVLLHFKFELLAFNHCDVHPLGVALFVFSLGCLIVKVSFFFTLHGPLDLFSIDHSFGDAVDDC